MKHQKSRKNSFANPVSNSIKYIITADQMVIFLSVSTASMCFSGQLEIALKPNQAWQSINCDIVLEDGTRRKLSATCKARSIGTITVSLNEIPVGYHKLIIDDAGREETARFLFVHPLKCFLPHLEKSERALNVQLYSLRSDKNWGIGDFSDLRDILNAASENYDYVGVNPLHALPPSKPEMASPYAPDSRILFNEIYIDVEAVALRYCSITVADRIAAVGKSAQVEFLRNSSNVQYGEVYSIKMRCLEAIFRALALDEFQFGKISNALQAFITDTDPLVISAIAERARQRNWKSISDPALRCMFELFLQWVCAEQLKEVQDCPSCGVYTDLAIGCKINSTDNVISGALFDVTRSLGAPPDAFCSEGQKWNVAPLNIDELRSTGYHYFRTILKQNMMSGGALRIDHIIGLMKRFTMFIEDNAASGIVEWVPIEEFLAIISIESHRNRCIVIGEDLGNVPEGLREVMVQRNVLGCSIYLLEKDDCENLTANKVRGNTVLFAFGTHDCIPMVGYFSGRDIALNKSLNRAEDDGENLEMEKRHKLYCSMFSKHGLDSAVKKDRITALYRLSDNVEARIKAYSLDDILGETEPVNIPGTDREYPNWRRRYARPVKESDFEK